MHERDLITNAILWAAAMLAAAIVGAPPVLSTVILPILAASALVLGWSRSRPASARCRR